MRGFHPNSPFLRLMFFIMLAGFAQGAHVVKRGETLYSIARANGVSVERLMEANKIKNPSMLQVGKRLVIPTSGSSKPSAIRDSSQRTSSSASTKSLVVIIDPGHGGKDRGAVRNGVRESALNLEVAEKLNWYLKKAGYRTVMTRTSDRFVSLGSRAAIANRYRNAVFVSIHFNVTDESWVKGVETYYGGSGRASYLASGIQQKMVAQCSLRNRGSRQRGFSVLRNTHCPAVLVECGFISNSSERSRCESSAHQDNVARAIAEGIKRYDARY